MEENISDWSQIMEVTEATVSDIDSDWLKNIDQSEVIFELFNKFFSQVRSVRLWFWHFWQNFQ